jgi:hypothetical protein
MFQVENKSQMSHPQVANENFSTLNFGPQVAMKTVFLPLGVGAAARRPSSGSGGLGSLPEHTVVSDRISWQLRTLYRGGLASVTAAGSTGGTEFVLTRFKNCLKRQQQKTTMVTVT